MSYSATPGATIEPGHPQYDELLARSRALYRKQHQLPEDEEIMDLMVLFQFPLGEDFDDTDAPEDVPMKPLSKMCKWDDVDAPDDAPLLKLSCPSERSQDWNQVRSSYAHNALVRVSDVDQTIDPIEKKPWLPSRSKRGTLEFCIHSPAIAPEFCLTMKILRIVPGATDEHNYKARHTSSVNWSAAGVTYQDAYNIPRIKKESQTVDNTSSTNKDPQTVGAGSAQNPKDTFEDVEVIPTKEVSNIRLSSSETGDFILTFDTEHAHCWNMKCLDKQQFSKHDRVANFEMNAGEKTVVKDLIGLTHLRQTGSKKTVQILILLTEKDKKSRSQGQPIDLDELYTLLPHRDNEHKGAVQFSTLPFASYRRSNGAPFAQHHQMPERKQALSCGPGLRLSPKYVFRDADEACIRLSNSAYTQYKEAKMIIEAMKREVHKVKLVSVGKMILARVSYRSALWAGFASSGDEEKLTIVEGTKVIATIYRTNDFYGEEARGHVVRDEFNLKGDLIILLDNKNTEDLPNMATPLASLEEGTSFDVRLDAQVTDTTTAYMIDSVSKMYARRPGYRKQFPALLNDGERLERISLFNHISADMDKFHVNYAGLMRAKAWGRLQIDCINRFVQGAPGRMILCTGPAGSGKTEVMVHLMKFCLDLGVAVLVTGFMNSTLDFITEAFQKKFPDAEAPLRAYSSSTENFGHSDTDFGSATEEAEQALLDLCMASLKEKRRKRHNLSSNSVQARVIENQHISGRPLMDKYTRGPRNGQPVYEDMEPIDMREAFKAFMEDLKSHPITDDEFWNANKKSAFRQCYKRMRCEVYQTSNIMVCTAVVSATPEAKKNFGKFAKVIARFDDEAQTMSEAMALIPCCQDYSDKIQVHIMFGDVEQAQVTIVAGRGPQNSFDEFIEQSELSLYGRLMLAGHPVIRFNTQRRLPLVLWKPLNMMFYEMRIKTHKSRCGGLEQRKDLMGEIAGYDKDMTLTEEQRRMLYIEVPHENTCMKSRSCNSRGNPAFVAIFVANVLGPLQKAFGNEVEQKVMLIVPYKRQIDIYLSVFFDLRSSKGYRKCQSPRVMSVDSAIGKEAEVVVVDLVNDDYEGFMRNPGRCCLMMSRAKEQVIYIGGSMAAINHETMSKSVRDVENNNKMTEILVKKSPLAFLHHYMRVSDCIIFKDPPAGYHIPSDLV